MYIIEQLQKVLSKKQPHQLCTCPKCNGQPKSFKLHAVRKRIFLVIVENFVQKLKSYLNRWKCPLCGKTFTYYPDFIIPYKQYTKDDIIRLSQNYIQDDNTSYRKLVTHDGLSIVYHDKERYFEGSTVWRWISYIGSLVQPLTNALSLIKKKSPSSNVFRQIRPISQKKYRSEGRRKILTNAMRFFIAQEELKKLFEISIFSPTLQHLLL